MQESTYNAIARAARAYPECFLDEDGREMTLPTWAPLVLGGQWKAPGMGPVRLREGLGEVLSRPSPAVASRD